METEIGERDEGRNIDIIRDRYKIRDSNRYSNGDKGRDTDRERDRE